MGISPRSVIVELWEKYRTIIAVFISAVGGFELAWQPGTTKHLPFRESANYSTWVILITTVFAVCPLVWIRGWRAMEKLKDHRGLLEEIPPYAVSGLLLIVFFIVVGRKVYPPEQLTTLPLISVRFILTFVVVAFAGGPSSLAMRRIGLACARNIGIEELVEWRAILQSQLAGLGALVIIGTVTTACYRSAVLAVPANDAVAFPPEYVLLFGAFITGALALVYLYPSGQLRRASREFVDKKYPLPDQHVADWPKRLQCRHDLSAALRIDESGTLLLQNALIIGGPLITTALTLLIPTS